MRINEIFYSLQGEGHQTGRAAVFIRFSGCNLRCTFCDTDFSSFREMSVEEIVSAATVFPARYAVLTGGEPALQADKHLIDALHGAGFTVAMETNGTVLPPEGIDWLTVSPKRKPVVSACDELKCIFDGTARVEDFGIKARYYYLQPCDSGHELTNRIITEKCVEYILEHPRWRLSLQTHKLARFK